MVPLQDAVQKVIEKMETVIFQSGAEGLPFLWL